MTRADVVVAGLGPGGAVAAAELARRGFRIVGLDPLRSYRKACGDAVVARREYHTILEKSGSIRHEIYNAEINVMGENVLTIRFNQPVWYIIDKRRLVGYLRETIEIEGGSVINKIFRKNHINFKADVIIDARGPYSHPQSTHILAYRYIVKTKEWENDTVLLDFQPDKSGLFWIFPSSSGDGYVNVGGGFKTPSIAYTRKLIKIYINKKFSNYSVVGEAGAPIAVYSNIAPVDDRVIRVGEAGGFINSAGGEGIRMALLSGLAAARALEENDPFNYYLRMVRRLLREAKLSRLLLKIVEGSPDPLKGRLLSELPEHFWRSFLSGNLTLGTVFSSVLASPRTASVVLRSLASSLS